MALDPGFWDPLLFVEILWVVAGLFFYCFLVLQPVPDVASLRTGPDNHNL